MKTARQLFRERLNAERKEKITTTNLFSTAIFQCFSSYY